MFRVACLGKPKWGAAGPGARSREPEARGQGEPGPRGGPVSGASIETLHPGMSMGIL